MTLKALLCKGLRGGLVSVGQATSAGYKFYFYGNYLKIFGADDKLLATVLKINNLYPLTTAQDKRLAAAANASADALLTTAKVEAATILSTETATEAASKAEASAEAPSTEIKAAAPKTKANKARAKEKVSAPDDKTTAETPPKKSSKRAKRWAALRSARRKRLKADKGEAGMHVANQATMKVSTKQLLHERMGHPSKGAPPDGICAGCAQGKLVNAPFPGSWADAARDPNRSHHTDLMGPLPVPSLGGARYANVFVQTVDDKGEKQRWPVVLFLKAKSEFPTSLETVNQRLLNDTGKPLGHVHSDNEKVLTSKAVKSFLASIGATSSTSPPYTPQSNPFAERFNRTLMVVAECLRHSAGLPEEFWAEAMDCACYLLEMRPNQSLEGKSPYEKKYGQQRSDKHLKRFGCAVWYPVCPKPKKLSPRRAFGVFIGYSRTSHGAIRVWDMALKKVKVVRGASCLFDEETLPFKTNDQIAQPQEPAIDDENDVAIDIADVNVDVDGADDIDAVDQGAIDEDGQVADDNGDADEPAVEVEPRRSDRQRQPPDRYDPDVYNFEQAAMFTDEANLEESSKPIVASRADVAMDDAMWANILQYKLVLERKAIEAVANQAGTAKCRTPSSWAPCATLPTGRAPTSATLSASWDVSSAIPAERIGRRPSACWRTSRARPRTASCTRPRRSRRTSWRFGRMPTTPASPGTAAAPAPTSA
jgi:hypothetical protein